MLHVRRKNPLQGKKRGGEIVGTVHHFQRPGA
jgi:hypothetical protein